MSQQQNGRRKSAFVMPIVRGGVTETINIDEGKDAHDDNDTRQ